MLFEQTSQRYSQHIGRNNKRSKSEYKIQFNFTLSVHNNKVKRHQKHRRKHHHIENITNRMHPFT